MNNVLKEEYNKRYEAMMNSDLGMTTSDLYHFDVINFENYQHYNVEIKSKKKVKCDCPDFVRRGIVPCKHILFVLTNIDGFENKGKEVYNEIESYFTKEVC